MLIILFVTKNWQKLLCTNCVAHVDTHEKCFRSDTYEVPLQLWCKRMQALDSFLGFRTEPCVLDVVKKHVLYSRTVSVILLLKVLVEYHSPRTPAAGQYHWPSLSGESVWSVRTEADQTCSAPPRHARCFLQRSTLGWKRNMKLWLSWNPSRTCPIKRKTKGTILNEYILFLRQIWNLRIIPIILLKLTHITFPCSVTMGFILDLHTNSCS